MDKRVVLRLIGNLEHGGFDVYAEVAEELTFQLIDAIDGQLPANPSLALHLEEWRQSYHQLSTSTRIIVEELSIQASLPSQIAICRRRARELQLCLETWLKSELFHDVSTRLPEALRFDETVRVLLRTNDKRLHHLPWHSWSLLKRYPKAEFAISTSAKPFSPIKRGAIAEKRVRILAILGDDRGIDTKADQDLFGHFPNADTQFLITPSRKEISYQLWNQHWDILFFAGHSRTEDYQGRIYINSQDHLTVDELKYGLEAAIEQGLSLAIFNSCDGLGLAYDLEQLNLPQLIVMREPVPDQVAHKFLEHFLLAYTKGDSFYSAERQARQRLEELEDEFPCATWLPVILQNPVALSPSWQNLLNDSTPQLAQPNGSEAVTQPRAKRSKATRFAQLQHGLLVLLAISLFVTSGVMEARSRGRLLAWELPVYDQILRWQPEKGQDKRLLLITIDDADIAYQQQQGWSRRWSLSDEALNLLLKKLEQYEPRSIGLDIIRDAPTDSQQTELVNRLQTTENLYVICTVQVPGDRHSGTLPPPEVLEGSRRSFNNVLLDPDGVVRRQILSMDAFPKSPCTASYALSTMLAFRYLAEQNIQPTFTSQGNLKLGEATFHRLQPFAAGYQDFGGNQILLNYRIHNQSPLDFVDTVTLTDVLTDRVQFEVLKDRTILIGAVTTTVDDRFATPFSRHQSAYEEIPGVVLHAQMLSQILSVALGEQSLLTVLPRWKETLGIWVWSLLASIAVLRIQSRFYLIVAGSAIACILYVFCYYSFSHGYWLALVPAMLAIILTSASMLLYLSIRKLGIHN